MKKLLVVTGGTKGIGRAIIDLFALNGFDIATCSRKEEDLNNLKSAIQAVHPQIEVHTKQADLSVKEEVKAFAEFVNNLKRPVEVLVNNAGFFVPGTIHEEKEGSLEAMIEGNLYSAYYMTRGLIGWMKTRKSGHIFNICSVASIKPYENGGSYSISKYALLGMTKNLREEMKAFGVRVTAVIPGATYTASWEGVDLPEERFMKSTDVAEAIYGTYTMSPNTVVEEIVLRPQLGDI
ncbi:SDR family oxidoreductase [Fulvivirgaceae bacterium BMA10]|uniref:SDR family oxidoreductase n=1 Tax=Splendidivirga corallicola TaxID=3051826 RepID=A0ABT8KT54_9BACT|nr:SDR family oxidoreductase [Fulvivirgaceae bacterium BMA10]